MGGFNKFDKGRNGKNFGGGGFGGPRKFGGNDGAPRQMFQATCSKCGQSCEVPFRPTGARPVFCRDCFKTEGTGGATPRFAPVKRFDDNRPSFGGNAGGNSNAGSGVTKAQIEALNVKLDKILSMLSSGSTAVKHHDTAKSDMPAIDVGVVKVKKAAGKKEKVPAKKAKSKKK